MEHSVIDVRHQPVHTPTPRDDSAHLEPGDRAARIDREDDSGRRDRGLKHPLILRGVRFPRH
jgi:hypothetical protein